jgi:aminopeptidase
VAWTARVLIQASGRIAMGRMDAPRSPRGPDSAGARAAIGGAIPVIQFDEKIGGTVHLAVGRSYPETGGTNESALHWDLIRDLRRGGRITADGELVQVDGRFVQGLG